MVLDGRPGADETFVTAERKQQVLRVLKELPEKDGELLRLIFLDEADKDGVCRRFGVDRGGEGVVVLLACCERRSCGTEPG